jgi:hypothetical protein
LHIHSEYRYCYSTDSRVLFLCRVHSDYKVSPSASFASAVNVICRNTDIFYMYHTYYARWHTLFKVKRFMYVFLSRSFKVSFCTFLHCFHTVCSSYSICTQLYVLISCLLISACPLLAITPLPTTQMNTLNQFITSRQQMFICPWKRPQSKIHIQEKIKTNIYKTISQPAVLFNSETWTLTEKSQQHSCPGKGKFYE